MADRQRVSVRGTFEVDVWTAGSGPPLVFLHGVAGLPAWPDWLDAFAADYRIIAPVLPGFGESTGLDDLTDFLDLTLYHLDLFDALGIERARHRRPLAGRRDRGGDRGDRQYVGVEAGARGPVWAVGRREPRGRHLRHHGEGHGAAFLGRPRGRPCNAAFTRSPTTWMRRRSR